MEDYKEFPSNEEFEKAFIKKDVYTGRLRNYTLIKLENYTHPKDRMSFENKDVTIEHVLPENKNLKPYWREVLGENWQELQKEYVHTIGNLTFSNRAYNSEMQDYSFEDKMKVEGGIKYSNYRLSDDIANSTKWDKVPSALKIAKSKRNLFLYIKSSKEYSFWKGILFSVKILPIISSPKLFIHPQDFVFPFRREIPRMDLIEPHFKH